MLSALLAAPGAAQPPSCDAPPGVAAVDQYCESTPGTPRDGRRTPRGDRDSGPGVPSDVERRVRDEPGGNALLESVPGGGAGPAAGGGADPSGGGGGRSADDDGRGARGGVPGSDVADAASGDAVSGVAAAGSSLWFGEMRWVIGLLALTLVAAVALGVRRRSAAD